MATARLASGKIVEVPDGLNSEQARSYLLRNGATFEEVGLEPYPMDPMGLRCQCTLTGQQILRRQLLQLRLHLP